VSTINEELARKVAANNGRYRDDPQAYAVFEYENSNFGGKDYAIVYDEWQFKGYVLHHRITEVLWPKDLAPCGLKGCKC